MHGRLQTVRWLLPLIGVIASLAYAVVPKVPPSPTTELISYTTMPGPFCGSCDSVTITALSDGRVWIEHGYWAGEYKDWEKTIQHTRVSAEQFARFRGLLMPYRPTGDLWLRDKPPCATFWTDMPELKIVWRGGGRDGSLWFNYGCDPATHEAMIKAFDEAPSALGIERIPRPDWVATTPM
jgi:hypothetical protein